MRIILYFTFVVVGFLTSCGESEKNVQAAPKNIDSLLVIYPDSVPLLVLKGNKLAGNYQFEPSTKEAYDAQFNTKSLTITVDGDVVNTSHWGNNVNIIYK